MIFFFAKIALLFRFAWRGLRPKPKFRATSFALTLHFLIFWTAIGLRAEEPETTPEVRDVSGEDRGRAGVIGGPSSVSGQIESNEAIRDSDHLFPLSGRIEKRWGLTIGGDYNSLWLGDLRNGGVNAAGGVARIYGEWKPFEGGPGSEGRLVFKIENRHRLGTDLSPQALGPSSGYAGLNAPTFSGAGPLLTNLYWAHRFSDNRFAFALGVIDVSDYLDVYGLVNPWEEFNNLAFSTNPSIPAPSQGLGAAFRFNISSNYYVLVGIADANGDPNAPSTLLDSFDTGEYFRHAEIGWYDSWENRYTDNIHFSFWQIDPRTIAGTGRGEGITFSASRLLQDRWLPFFRAGIADGGGSFVDRSISMGTGYKLNEENDYLGVGVNWGRSPLMNPWSPRDQYTAEIYYRKNLNKILQITPSAQYLANPANLPSGGSGWIFGIRARAVF